MDLIIKNHWLKFLLVVMLILTSCKNETCKDVIYKDGRSFKNGSPYSGTCIDHHSNGEIRSIQNYANGYDHGKWKFFYSDKTIQTEGFFVMGKKDRKWLYYHKNGTLSKEHFYENGKKVGVWKKFDEDGALIEATVIGS